MFDDIGPAIFSFQKGSLFQLILFVGTGLLIGVRGAQPAAAASTQPSPATTLPSDTPLPAREFRSKLALRIFLVNHHGVLPFAYSDLLGQMPAEKAVNIPADRLWCVFPDPATDLQLVTREIQAQQIPGLALESVPAGTDLAFLKNLNDLRMLLAQGPGMTDAALENLQGLTSLRELYLDGTPATDAGLIHLKGLTGLRELSLRYTEISDDGLKKLRGMTSLQTLYLSDHLVTDAGLENLKGLMALEPLDLSNTQVTAVGLRQLARLPVLQTINVRGMIVTTEEEAALWKAMPTCHIVGMSRENAKIVSGTVVSSDEFRLVVHPGVPRTNGIFDGNAGAAKNGVAFPVDEYMQILIDNVPGSWQDLKPSMLVYVDPSGTRLNPAFIRVSAPAEEFFGVVVKVDGMDIVVMPAQPVGEHDPVTVVTNEETQFVHFGMMVKGKRSPPGKTDLEDIKPGMRVAVVPSTGTATKITVIADPSDAPTSRLGN